MKHTKLDMARVIVQALYRLPALPAKGNVHVVRTVRHSRVSLERQHGLAIKIILDGVEAGTWPKAAGECFAAWRGGDGLVAA